jgi:protein TonB
VIFRSDEENFARLVESDSVMAHLRGECRGRSIALAVVAMFELISGGGAGRSARAAWPMVISTIAHAATVIAIVALPLLYVTDQLPEVPVMMAFVAAPPPPPPPPPPPAPRLASTSTPRAVPASGAFAAPLEAPSQIEPEAGIDRGFEGGVPGGVEGGIPGGVLGGVVGGLPSEAPAPPPPPPPARKPVRVGGQIQSPALVERTPPEYPEIAVKARIQGTVILEATVDEDGRVQDVRVLRSLPFLDQPAVDAVRRWRYSPLLLNGQAQPFILTVTVSFRIPDATTMP